MHTDTFAVTESVYKNNRCYGIEIVAESGETYRYDFISPFEDEAKLLADRMSAAEDLSAIHFKDIVRDYLTELYLSAIDANNLTSAI